MATKQSVNHSFKETLRYLYTQLPMFQRQGATAMKKNLDNIIALCAALNNPQEKFRSIHIAGTNGKGSTCHMLSALFQSQGYTVGVYTSPHYKDFRERIKINSTLVSKKFVVDFVANIQQEIDRIRPSFFEITVAMAFQYFAEQNVDFAIIEVGLGGRLDSTNIITPLVSIITNISKDHTQFLGDTIPEIAGEKAGIIKAKIPVVIGERQVETANVFAHKAKMEATTLHYSDSILDVDYTPSTHQVRCMINQQIVEFVAEWMTDYQALNLRTALAAFVVFAESIQLEIKWEKVPTSLSQMPELTYFLGRWMQLSSNPTVIAESAHNEAGLQEVFRKLTKLSYKKIHFVLGFSDDKDLSSILEFFPESARYYFAKADIPRGMKAQKLQRIAKEHGLHGRSYVSVKNALKAANRVAEAEDLIYVGGSIFVVAEVI